MGGYLIGLEELSEREIELGCKRVLKEWGYTFMPPPAYIRSAVAAELEIERNRAPRKPMYESLPRLTLDEAWADWEETQKLQEQMRAALGLVLKEQGKFPAESIEARRERLKKQGEEIKKRYAKG